MEKARVEQEKRIAAEAALREERAIFWPHALIFISFGKWTQYFDAYKLRGSMRPKPLKKQNSWRRIHFLILALGKKQVGENWKTEELGETGTRRTIAFKTDVFRQAQAEQRQLLEEEAQPEEVCNIDFLCKSKTKRNICLLSNAVTICALGESWGRGTLSRLNAAHVWYSTQCPRRQDKVSRLWRLIRKRCLWNLLSWQETQRCNFVFSHSHIQIYLMLPGGNGVSQWCWGTGVEN